MPGRCALCRGAPPRGDGLACQTCLHRLRPPGLLPQSEHVEKYYSAFAYDGLARAAILRFKDRGATNTAKFFARAAYEAFPDLEDFDMLVPVPLHKNRLKSRGFNQARLFGQWLALEYQKPIYDILIRTRDTDRLYQVEQGRHEYLRGVFAAKPGADLLDKRILLVDDILTSGATTSECAAALKMVGALTISAITIAAATRRDHKGE